MSLRYPQRKNSHQLEEISERYFTSRLPGNWTSEKPTPDYGVDLRVDIYEGSNATGLELLIQQKASKNGNGQTYETVRLRTSTYNYLWDKLQVVMLVKYVESENRAYWLLLKDVPQPSQEQDTFTIRIPKENDLENINWPEIQNYVREVTDQKLTARRRDHLHRQTA